MSRWVVDCSLVMGWCLPDEASNVADRFFEDLPTDTKLEVPALFWYEIANTLAVAVRRGRIALSQAERLRQLLCALPLTTNPARPGLTSRLLPLAARLSLSAYDAAYLDLAVQTDARLATLDTGLQAAASEEGVAVFEID
jgi:predicted nucleic acid-binding protein